jgi:septum formation protein
MIVLASASATRAALLERAGLYVQREAARIDESEIKRDFQRRRGEAAACAMALAEAKARDVAAGHPGALVIGADQLLACGSLWLDKPRDREDARSQLLELRGRTHELPTAACVVRDNAVMWRTIETPRLAMRDFTASFLDSYLDGIGREDLGAVGAYRIEGLGVQLFARIEGDYFSILGLPLLPLLDFLRAHGEIAP